MKKIPLVLDNQRDSPWKVWVLTLESAAFGGGRIIASHSTGGSGGAGSTHYEPNYFITDHLGSTRVVVDGEGQVLERNDYYAFGSRWTSADAQASTNRFLFNGKEAQTTGDLNFLDYGARMYDARLGRWLVIDPLAKKYYKISPYTYCANNPLRYIDPDGKKIVDAKGNTITYSKSASWSSNATPSVIAIGNAMMRTTTGARVLNAMMSTSYPITMNLYETASIEKNANKLGHADCTYNKKTMELIKVDISLYRSEIEKEVNNIREASQPGVVVTGDVTQKFELLMKQQPSVTDRIGQVGAHEGEHATNRNAQSGIVGTERAEAQAVKVETQVIKEELEKVKRLMDNWIRSIRIND